MSEYFESIDAYLNIEETEDGFIWCFSGETEDGLVWETDNYEAATEEQARKDAEAWAEEKARQNQEIEDVSYDDDYNAAIAEFQRIASHTDGINGSQYKSSNGYEFIIWIEDEIDIPEVSSALIETSVLPEENKAGETVYKFSMTLPYESDLDVDELNEVMTAGEVVEQYSLSDAAVRVAISRGQIRARKSGGTWLLRRVDVEAKWGEPEFEFDYGVEYWEMRGGSNEHTKDKFAWVASFSPDGEWVIDHYRRDSKIETEVYASEDEMKAAMREIAPLRKWSAQDA